VHREGEKHQKVEWVVTLYTFTPTRERKMEDINVLTIPKRVLIYSNHFQYSSHGAHKCV